MGAILAGFRHARYEQRRPYKDRMMRHSMLDNPEMSLEKEIKRFVAENEANRFTMIDNSPMFDEPLIGFADGDDEIFDTYKEVVGDFHWKPR
ncbi:hypothetical protein HZA56_15180, partial [Candidatus Poribacteria bacterium]|nr:hypothetical protein [Candidatus Poribacteria bacterium]